MTNVALPAASSALSLGSALQIGGLAFSALGALSQGAAAQRQAEFNARQSQQEAARRRQIAGLEASDFRKRQGRLLARQRALLGASGVDPGSGTPLLVAEDTAGEIELNAQRILAGGATEATRLENTAALQRAKGRAGRTASFLRTGSLIFDGAKSFA